MKSRHSLILAGILLIGLALRFWNLNAKPVWLDETITALFSLGRSYTDVPLNQAFAIADLDQIFRLNAGTTCPRIVSRVTTQSVHPPLFFCWLHDWMRWLQPLEKSWLWKLRAFPALWGGLAIAAVYHLNRVVFSPRAGLAAAALMAVSPFAVYLSQEARHYTLPIVLVLLALIGLHQILIDLQQPQHRPAVWFGWIAVNSVGFYVHYFFLLSFIAQVATLLLLLWQQARDRKFKLEPSTEPVPRSRLIAVVLAISAVVLTYVPWLPTFVHHLSRPETDWLQRQDSGWLHWLAPLYQIPIGWILMVIALPVERQPPWLEIAAGVMMIGFSLWLAWQVAGRLKALWNDPATRLPTRLLGFYVLVVLLEFLAIVYLLGKDITQVPRYNFIYFPAICALLGAALSLQPSKRWRIRKLQPRPKLRRRRAWSNLQIWRRSPPLIAIVLLASTLSSVLVVSDLVFQKPYDPTRVARSLWVEPERPLVVATAYGDLQDVALGLSFALALEEQHKRSDALDRTRLVFLERSKKSSGYKPVWKALANLDPSLRFPLNLWLVAPGLKRKNFPEKLRLGESRDDRENCKLDPEHYHRRGIPYQLYRCSKPQPD
jgi:uncharacterized membrane protein